ncbi:hypothetical protein JB92DRAFT_882584 [Gautieria morchelliformis]|nr:hypothetical protein JB92DRAFT_882584 [Gautieria morchelliformis]
MAPASSQSARPTPPPSKPAEEDRIVPVETAYTPVCLPAPKKLVNPFDSHQRAGASNASVAREPPVSSKKLTWSERQALAKKQQAEEEARFEAASVTTATAVDVNRVGSVAAAAADRQACQRGGQAV